MFLNGMRMKSHEKAILLKLCTPPRNVEVLLKNLPDFRGFKLSDLFAVNCLDF